MTIRLDPHAQDRSTKCGATDVEVLATVESGERFPAKFGRPGRQDSPFANVWRGRHYSTKQIEAYAVDEDGDWLVITVIVKYFGEKETGE